MFGLVWFGIGIGIGGDSMGEERRGWKEDGKGWNVMWDGMGW